ncbi:hypothetical protein V6U89_05655 [Micromonospora sp. CPCC 206171]|uniref:hypothetical protein n=1 Tax=Micromonospora sp. CPCC 206171 TaxID=3122405 RepID=UPI002FF0CC13
MTGRTLTRAGDDPPLALQLVGTGLIFFALELARPNSWLTESGDAPIFLLEYLAALSLVDLLWSAYARRREGDAGTRAGSDARVPTGRGSLVARWLAWATAVLVWSFLAHRVGDLADRSWVRAAALALLIVIAFGAAPRQRGVGQGRLPLVLVGLPLLVGAVILGARTISSSWPAAADRALTSPYTWLAVVAWLDYVVQDRRTEDGRRRWPALRAAGGLLLAVACLAAIFGPWWPDRWYGTLARMALALFGAVWFARVAHLVPDPSPVEGGADEPATPPAPATDDPGAPEDRADPRTSSAS